MMSKRVPEQEKVCTRRSDLHPKADRSESTREKNVECMYVLWTWRRDIIGLTGKHYGRY